MARDAAGPESIAPAWELLLDAFLPRLERAEIDAYPHPQWGQPWARMSAEAREAQQELQHRAELRGHGEPLAVELDLSIAEDVQLLRVFGPWTISSQASDAARELLVGTDDEGTGCYAQVPLRDAVDLGAFLERQGLSFDVHFKIGS